MLAEDGTAALSATAFSKSGEYFAYGISRSVSVCCSYGRFCLLLICRLYGNERQGSDFYTVYVRPTSKPLAPVEGQTVSHDTGRLKDEVRFVKFSSISWTHDSKGFFYQVFLSIFLLLSHDLGSSNAFSLQRFPDRQSHGSADEDKAGTETQSDKDALLYYHRVGTPQCKSPSWTLFLIMANFLNSGGCLGTQRP